MSSNTLNGLAVIVGITDKEQGIPAYEHDMYRMKCLWEARGFKVEVYKDLVATVSLSYFFC